MIVLSKKRIYIMLSMIIVATLAFSFKIADKNKILTNGETNKKMIIVSEEDVDLWKEIPYNGQI